MASASARYHPALIALHWIVLGLIAVAYAAMEFRDAWPKGSDTRELLKTVHYTVGLTVFLLVFARVALRLTNAAPAVTPPLPPLMNLASWGLHVALYGFMIVMPLLGWATLSAEGDPISFLGIPLPAIAPESEDLKEVFEETHELIGKLGYALIAAHAAAALYHHYIRKDDTLRRMLPW